MKALDLRNDELKFGDGHVVEIFNSLCILSSCLKMSFVLAIKLGMFLSYKQKNKRKRWLESSLDDKRNH